MRTRWGLSSASIPVVLMIAAVLGSTLGPAGAAATPVNRARIAARADLPSNVRRLCPPPVSVTTMACLGMVRTDVPGHLGPMSFAPAGYGPAQLQNAYNLASASASRGQGETVELVDAYNDPRAAADLAVYRAQFGLAPCDPATGAGCLTTRATGAGSLPRPDAAWAAQESMDIDMVTAICPRCHILLLETGSVFEPDLASNFNASFASLGFAEPENPAFFDNVGSFAQSSGMAIAVAAGDDGYGAQYPALSQFVTAVGGTSLVRDASSARGWAETAWSATSSGCSAEQFQPPWQDGLDTGCAMRAGNDVAAVADPETGVAFYDSYRSGGWGEGGGTNVSSAIIAAVYALAGPPAPNTFPVSYPYRHPGALYDVTAGSDGTCGPSVLCTAGPGYDGPTGLGSPDGTAAFWLGPAKNVITVSAIAGRGLSLTVGRPISTYYLHALDSSTSEPVSIRVSGLPPGLSMTNVGGLLIKGTPTSPGTFLVRLRATDPTGASGTLTLPVHVYADAITISAPSQEWTPVGTVLSPVSIQASDSASAEPLTFSAAHLPPGLSLTQTGPVTAAISGTAGTAGRFGGLITVTDGTGASQVARIDWGVFGTLTIAGPPDVVSTAGDPVLLNFHVTDSEPGATVSYGQDGPTPLGTGMNFGNGQISGWPILPGVYHDAFLATDNYGATARAPFTWTVRPAPDAGPTGPVRLSLARLCLTTKNGGQADGTAVVISRCDGTSGQRWTVVQDGTLRLGGKCLGTVHHSLNSGAKADLAKCTASLSQQWRIFGQGGLSDIYSGLCLADPRGSTSNGTQLVSESCGTSSSQRWTLPSGPIASIVPGMCVTDPGDASAPGTVVVSSSCAGAPGQDWTVEADGTIAINSRCLAYGQFGAARKPSVHLAACTGAQSERWSNVITTSNLELEPSLENQAASACLDDPRASAADGTPLRLGPCPTWSGPLSTPGISWRVS